MFATIPFILALLIAEIGLGRQRVVADAGSAGWGDWLLIGTSLCLWILACLLAGRLLIRFGRSRRLPRYEAAGFAFLLGLHAWWCLLLGWPPIDLATVAIAPFALGVLALWTGLARAVNALTGSGRSTTDLLALRFKFALLPIGVFLLLLDALQVVLLVLLGDGWDADGDSLVLPLLLAGLFLPLVILLPWLLVRLWGARPLPPGHRRVLVEECLARSGVRVHQILRWPTGRGRMFNAAVLGFVSRFRYVLVTDALLERLSDDELRGVLGHELGHVRHRHLWLYLLFLVTAGQTAFLLATATGTWLGLAPFGLTQTGITVAVWFLLLYVVFGFLSRACERQADLAGIELCDDPRNMRSALATVARHAGIDPDTPNWRHHSITARIGFLRRVEADPGLAFWHHRLVMRLRTVIWIALLAVIVIWSLLSRPSAVPLRELVTRHPELDAAVLTALTDRDTTDLKEWLQGSESAEATGYLQAVQLLFFDDERLARDDRLAYAYCPLLEPYIAISTGRGPLDRSLQNCLVYCLAAGQARPSQRELDIIRLLLPKLEDYNADLQSARLADTIGCAHFVLGDRDAAREAFRQTLEWLPEARFRAEEPVSREEFTTLVRARLEACDNLGVGLPKFWGEVVTEPAPPAATGGDGGPQP